MSKVATVNFCSKSSLQGCFPSSWGEGLCWATLGVSQHLQGSQQTVPVSVHPCTLGTCPILPWWGPWPLWPPPPPPEQLLLRFLNPGMNLGQGESCEPQTSQPLLFPNQQGFPGPHPTPALPPLRLARATTTLAQPACPLQACPSSQLAPLPRVTLTGSPESCGSVYLPLETHAGR